MTHHARLRKCEGEENADRVERNQPAGIAAECYDQHSGENCEDDDAIRKNQLVATGAELPRNETIPGEQAGKPREIGEGSVRCEDQDQGCRSLNDIVKPAHWPGEDDARELRDYRFILSWMHLI